MSQDVPSDAVYLTCAACGATTWLTPDEAARCAGTQLGCAQCGRDIDILPGGSPPIEELRTKMALPESEYSLSIDRTPAPPPYNSAPPHPVRSQPSSPSSPPPPRRDPQRDPPQRNDRQRPDRNAVPSARESSVNESSGSIVAFADRGDGESTRTPPRAVRKQPKPRPKPKKKKKKSRAPAESAPEMTLPKRKGGVSFEVDDWIPVGLSLASLVVFVAVASFTVPEKLDASAYIWHKLGFALTVVLIGTPALLAAAVVFGISLGELKMVLIKIPMIVLTQAWTEDLLTLQPLPYVPTFGAWAATLCLCMNAFDIEGLEAQVTMCIVRGTHTAVFWTMFAGALSPPGDGNQPGQNWLFQPQMAGQQQPADNPPPADKPDAVKLDADESDDPPAQDPKPGADKTGKTPPAGSSSDESPPKKETPGSSQPGKPGTGSRPVPQDSSAEERSLALTQKFGEALVSQDYERAYALMSRRYQQSTTLEAFAALHRQAKTRYGKPLKAEAGIGDEGEESLSGPEFDRFRNIPPKERFAWTYANLTTEPDNGQAVRCCDCWLLLVKIGKAVKVGAFEYEACE